MLTLRFFAQLADRAQTSECACPWAPTARRVLEAKSLWLGLISPGVKVAVNNRWSDWDSPLTDGDIVDFMPPWSLL